ncbi:hypothetical protein MRX96_007604 [Rhipicephalus microplus]
MPIGWREPLALQQRNAVLGWGDGGDQSTSPQAPRYLSDRGRAGARIYVRLLKIISLGFPARRCCTFSSVRCDRRTGCRLTLPSFFSRDSFPPSRCACPEKKGVDPAVNEFLQKARALELQVGVPRHAKAKVPHPQLRARTGMLRRLYKCIPLRGEALLSTKLTPTNDGMSRCEQDQKARDH